MSELVDRVRDRLGAGEPSELRSKAAEIARISERLHGMARASERERSRLLRQLHAERQALDRIAAALCGVEWTPDTLEKVAEIVTSSGRVIYGPDFDDDPDADDAAASVAHDRDGVAEVEIVETTAPADAREFLVHWTINVDAATAEQAAAEALRLQRDPESEATVFEVFEVTSRINGQALLASPVEVDVAEHDSGDGGFERLARYQGTPGQVRP